MQRAAFHFNISENVSTRLSEDVMLDVLSSIFYGVSEEGNELITATLGLRAILPRRCGVEDKIRVFNIYGADDCIPTYDQLTLKKGTSIQKTFEK